MVNIPIFDTNSINEKIKGIVKIFKNDEQVEESENLVVYMGRKFALMNTFKLSTGSDVDYTPYTITHFGIGSGGTSTSDITAIVGPTDTDTTLYKALSLNTVDTTNYFPVTDATGTTVQGALKRINYDGSFQIIKDSVTNDYTTIKLTLNIDPTTVDISLPSTYLINEAAIYFTDAYGPKGIFAHVCFPGKYMTNSDKIRIEWYFLF